MPMFASPTFSSSPPLLVARIQNQIHKTLHRIYTRKCEEGKLLLTVLQHNLQNAIKEIF